MPAMVGILHINLSITGCRSLKEKRSRIQPILHRLHREFNLSVAEMELQDKWNTSAIACAVISNDAVHCQQVLQHVDFVVEAVHVFAHFVAHGIRPHFDETL